MKLFNLLLVSIIIFSCIFIYFVSAEEIEINGKIVDDIILDEFNNSTWVAVMIELENISESDNFIAGLSESDSILYRQTSRKIGLKITEVGFDKLLNDPRVKAIYPGHVEIYAIEENRSNEDIVEEQKNKTEDIIKKLSKGILLLGGLTIILILILYFLIKRKK